MKNLIIFCAYFFSLIVVSEAQLPQDYPFKVMLDDSGFVFITGTDNDNIVTSKYNLSADRIWRKEYYNPGFDRGIDLSLTLENVYVTGYITNSSSGKFDIILLKLGRYNDGNFLWTKTFGDINYDDQAFGIVNDASGDIYICGYETSEKNKNIKIIKSNRFNGDAIWQTSFDGSLHGDDIGTDILIDDYHLYVLGSTYQGSNYDDDIIQLSYRLNNFSDTDTLIFHHKGKETPTSFIISDLSENILQKSKTSMTVITDNFSISGSKDFLTLTFKGKEFIWKQQFNGNNLDDVPTAIDAYDSSLYVTGFSYRNPMNSDFSTIKYKLFEEGAYGWTDTAVRYFDFRGGKDQGSSVKVKDRDTIYIAGVSELAENSFVIKKYSQTNGGGSIILAWERFFSPDIDNIQQYVTMKKASVLELDGSDNVYQINYFWNDYNKYYSIVKYDANGNQLYAIDNITDGIDDTYTLKNSGNKISKLSNYPNPFNPSTQIKFELSSSSNIKLNVYDLSGKEIAIIVNEYRLPGNYSETFNAGNLSSGIYFYSIYANDILVDTKKCLLIK